MAFEVARVHGIIRSNIRDDGSSKLTEEMVGSDVREEAPSAAAAAWPDVVSSPLASSSSSSSSPRSTETESVEGHDDEELLAGLTEQVAQTAIAEAPRKVAVGSPQSSWSSRSCCSSSSSGSSSGSGHWRLSSTVASSSSKGSSRVSSQVSSPPTTPVDIHQSDAWDLLYAAAGEVVRMKMNEQQQQQHQQQQKRFLSSFPVSRYHQQHHVQTQRVQNQHVQTYPPPPQACHQPPPLQACHQTPHPPPQAYLQAPPAHVRGGGGGGGGPGHMVPAARNAALKAAVSSLGPPQCLPYLHSRTERIAIYGSNNRQSWQNSSAARVIKDCRPYNRHQMAAAAKVGPEEAGSRFQSRQQHPVYHQHQASRPGVGGKGCQEQFRSSERIVDYNNNARKWTAANGGGGGSGMRAVFLGSGGSGRESSGTGVFLPRCTGNGPELKRKPVCSTVLLPSRIVQVLNLNVDNIPLSHPSLPSSFVHSTAACPGHSTSMPMPTMPAVSRLSGRALRPSKLAFEDAWLTSCGKACPSVLQPNAAPELSLPSEWTY